MSFFPQFADWLGNSVQALGLLQVHLKSCRSKSASSPKIFLCKIRRNIYFLLDCDHENIFKSISIALLAKYFENEEGKHLVGPTFAQ